MEVKEIKNKTRYIQSETERMLWAVSAGICEFRGCCNKLYTHHVTKENVHQRKCEEEKQKKKALMQLLLTGIVRV